MRSNFMKIGIMSDSHDHLDNIKKAVQIFNMENVDIVVHCGDFVAPFAIKPLRDLTMKVFACYGNNDGEKVMLQKIFQEFGIEIHQRNQAVKYNGKNILLMHEPDFPDIYAESGEFDLICYGHTHHPDIHKLNDIYIVNPGETCGWLTGNPTIVLADLARQEVEVVSL